MTYPAMFLYKTIIAFNPELNLAPIITLLYSALNWLCRNVIEITNIYAILQEWWMLWDTKGEMRSSLSQLCYWRFRSPGMWLLFCWVSASRCLEGLQFHHLQGPAVRELLDPEYEGKVIYQNIGNYLPNKTVSHSRGSQSLNVK